MGSFSSVMSVVAHPIGLIDCLSERWLKIEQVPSGVACSDDVPGAWTQLQFGQWAGNENVIGPPEIIADNRIAAGPGFQSKMPNNLVDKSASGTF